MKKAVSLLILALFLSSTFAMSTVEAGTINGDISQDTTLTKEGMPYAVTGTVVVQSGVTLTIEPGVTLTVNQGSTLQVEGTLIAKGSSDEAVILNGYGNLVLTAKSPGWNPQTQSGTVFEHCVINALTVTVCNSARFNNSFLLNRMYLCGGSPQITWSSIVGTIDSNQSLQSPVIANNDVEGTIIINGGSPTITQNVIKGINRNTQTAECTGIVLIATYGKENRLYNAVITDNTITDCLDGISSLAEGGLIANNFISNCGRNALALGTMPETDLYATVQNNTITNSTVGVELFNYNYMEPYSTTPPPPFIHQNNIYGNNQCNIYSYSGMNIYMTDNWWGTTDASTIKKTIHDHSADSALGVIESIPCLTGPNPFAHPNSNGTPGYPVTNIPPIANSTSPISTPQTSRNSTATPPPNSFTIESNSTVSALSFNATNQEINFTVNGMTGTTGYVKVTVAKAFMPNSEKIKVYLDGNPINYTITSSQDNWEITFTYHHSIHQVKINQGDNPAIAASDNQNIGYILIGVVAAVLALLSLVIWAAKKKE